MLPPQPGIQLILTIFVCVTGSTKVEEVSKEITRYKGVSGPNINLENQWVCSWVRTSLRDSSLKLLSIGFGPDLQLGKMVSGIGKGCASLLCTVLERVQSSLFMENELLLYVERSVTFIPPKAVGCDEHRDATSYVTPHFLRSNVCTIWWERRFLERRRQEGFPGFGKFVLEWCWGCPIAKKWMLLLSWIPAHIKSILLVTDRPLTPGSISSNSV